MTLDLSKIPNVEARRRLVELEAERDRVDEERAAAVRPMIIEAQVETERLAGKYRAERAAAMASYHERMDAVAAPFDARFDEIDAEIERLIGEIECGDRICSDDLDRPLNCALTGLPVMEEDETITDEIDGETILRDALPWPAPEGASDEAASWPSETRSRRR